MSGKCQGKSCQGKVDDCDFYHLHVQISVAVMPLVLMLFLLLTRDIDIANLSVRYVTVLYENGITYCHSFFTTP